VFAKLWKESISCVMSVSVRPSTWNNSVPTGRIFIKLYIWDSFENLSRKFVWLKSDKNKGDFTEELCLFLIMPHWILHRMKNVSGKSCRENQHILCSAIFLWDVERYGTAPHAKNDNTIWRMRFACRITTARIDIRAEYLILTPKMLTRTHL
jgi:hypothetical protein